MKHTGVAFYVIKIAFASLFMSVMSVPVSAGIYKWTDENGEVHYSQQRPENSSEAKKMKVDSPPSGSDKAQEDLKQYQEDLDTMMKDKANREKQQAAEQKQKEVKQKNCDNARNRLTKLNAPAKIFYKGESGDMQYMDEKQRTQEREQAQSLVDKWCQ